ncbi:hypothetical protein E3N88_25074 [Mikania micrantha]|uniref:Uncharacterized protein n=1 Tax=Mikania micrantha TaxID=192012 RepID=A0A5N6N556_9ASTR|nr:hypothetical protein E3N88_25074 [Mikania micrantha]
MENKPSIFVENDDSDELHTGGGEGLTNQTADARGRGGLTNQKAGVVGCCPNLKKRRREKNFAGQIYGVDSIQMINKLKQHNEELEVVGERRRCSAEFFVRLVVSGREGLRSCAGLRAYLLEGLMANGAYYSAESYSIRFEFRLKDVKASNGCLLKVVRADTSWEEQ